MRHSSKAIRRPVILLILCSVLISGCTNEVAAQQSYATISLETGSISSAIAASGMVYASQSVEYSLPIKTAISEVYVREGGMVKAGDLLYSVEETYFTEQLAVFDSSFYQALEYSEGVYKTQVVTAPMSGSVRMLEAKPGINVLSLSATSSLCVIVMSDVMRLELVNDTLNKNDEVIVGVDAIEQKGKVVDVRDMPGIDRTVVIEISTSCYNQGSNAKVYYPDINTFIGEGKLAYRDKKAIYMTEGYVSQVYVSEGDYVKRGDKLFTVCIPSNDSWSSLEKIIATKDGRIKLLKAQSGSEVSDIMDEYDQLAVISTAGTMYVDIESEELQVGDTVGVSIGDYVIEGSIVLKTAKTARVEITDDTYEIGMLAEVTFNGESIGSGDLELTEYESINSPYGTISLVYVEENDTVEMGDYLFNVSIPSQKIVTNYANIEDLYKQMEQIDNYMLNNAVYATCDGIIGSINYNPGDTVEASQAVVSVNAATDYIIDTEISINYLNDVSLGQKSIAEFSNGISLEGSISHVDYNADSDVIALTIDLNDCTEIDSGEILPGMYADLNIITAESENTSYLPTGAVYSSNQGDYVMLLDENEEMQVVYITTGIKTDEYVEVLSGLESDDKVVVYN